MASVTFLGTGPGSVLPGRFQTAILLQSGEASILLDAGEPCAAQLLNLGFSLPDLDAVWISHAHSDHVGGLPLLLQASWIHGRVKPLPLGLPSHLVDPFTQWLRAVLLPPEVLPFSLDTFAWADGQPRKFADLQVIPHRTSHLDRTREKMGDPAIESFLFEILTAKQRIIYSADIGSMEDLLPHLDRPVDWLICELGHVTVEELIAGLSSAKIGTLCLTHLSAEAEERRGEIKLQCDEQLPHTDAVYLPDDGEEIDL